MNSSKTRKSKSVSVRTNPMRDVIITSSGPVNMNVHTNCKSTSRSSKSTPNKSVGKKQHLQQTENKNDSHLKTSTTKCELISKPQNKLPAKISSGYCLLYQGGCNEIPLKEFSNFHIINQTPQIIALCTLIRNKETKRKDFVFYSDRLFRLLVEEALAYFPFVKWTVPTPTGADFDGLKFTSKICGVSIVRAGESMEKALRDCIPNVRIGKILVQRLEDGTARPQHFYTKYPSDIAERMVILMDPMLATGGSAMMAIQSLEDAGVRRENIVFINMVAAPEGVRALCSKFPEVRIISCVLDSHLNELKYIVPGLGDFGDRYFGTD